MRAAGQGRDRVCEIVAMQKLRKANYIPAGAAAATIENTLHQVNTKSVNTTAARAWAN
jgi:hypothetical protein